MANIEMPPLKSSGRVSTPGQQLHLTTSSLNGNEISSTAASDKKYSCRHYASKVLQNLNFLRQNTRFCDVEIVAGGRVMKVKSNNIKIGCLVFYVISTLNTFVELVMDLPTAVSRDPNKP